MSANEGRTKFGLCVTLVFPDADVSEAPDLLLAMLFDDLLGKLLFDVKKEVEEGKGFAS